MRTGLSWMMREAEALVGEDHRADTAPAITSRPRMAAKSRQWSWIARFISRPPPDVALVSGSPSRRTLELVEVARAGARGRSTSSSWRRSVDLDASEPVEPDVLGAARRSAVRLAFVVALLVGRRAGVDLRSWRAGPAGSSPGWASPASRTATSGCSGGRPLVRRRVDADDREQRDAEEALAELQRLQAARAEHLEPLAVGVEGAALAGEAGQPLHRGLEDRARSPGTPRRAPCPGSTAGRPR